MRRVTAVTAATLSSLALTGALVAPAVTAQEKRATLTFNDTTIREKQLSPTIFVLAGVDKRNGQVIGYSSVRGQFNPANDTATVTGAFALRGGHIFVRVVQDADADEATGDIIGGTNKFADIDGTVTVVNSTQKTARITLNYTL